MGTSWVGSIPAGAGSRQDLETIQIGAGKGPSDAVASRCMKCPDGVRRRGMRTRRTDPVRGKVVVVTGASSGIGRAVGLAFARRGARVVLAARSADVLCAEARR
ncbi:SDR family NAD(P)-dependent oxidoreductase, partial [Streptomyces hydrogenans]|uniref:SDR family NAD(P)-dependent oxidoreductase n=1 Tax=Streptomyces hydrogenans TaxID=1873719 RepID=UPI0027E46880